MMEEDQLVLRISRILIVPLAAVVLIPLLFTELHIFSSHDLVGSAIPDTVFLEHAAQGLVRGHIPYSSNFMVAPDTRLTFIYPPLSLVLSLSPLLAGGHYSLGFSIQMVVLTGVGLLALHVFCRRCGISFPIALTAAVLLVAVGPVLLTRLDGVQGLALAGAALALRSRRMALAVALVTLSVLVKETVVVALIPVVVWALWPAAEVHWSDGLGRRAAAVGWGLVPALVVAVTFLVWSRGQVLSAAFAAIHRGVEIESIPASISYLTHPLLRLHSYIGQLGSSQVSGPQVTVAAAVAGAIGVVALVWGAIHFAREGRRPVTTIAFAVAVSMTATPVLSPQYVLGFMPVLVLAAALEFTAVRSYLLLGTGLITALLTQAEFPYLFSSVAALEPPGMIVVVVRNLLLIALAVNLARAAPLPAPAVAGLASQPGAPGLVQPT